MNEICFVCGQPKGGAVGGAGVFDYYLECCLKSPELHRRFGAIEKIYYIPPELDDFMIEKYYDARVLQNREEIHSCKSS